MALVIRYSVDSVTTETWGTPRQGKVSGMVMKADQGTVGSSKILLPDPGGDHVVRGLRRLTASESDSPADFQVIYVGNLGARDYGRDAEHILGMDRLTTVSLVDLNNLLSTYIIQGPATAAGGVRPDETDYQRIVWLLTSAFISEQVNNFGLVSALQQVNMDGADLRGQNAGSVLRDAGLLSGRQWFLYYDESQPTGTRIGLFYDFAAAEVFSSTLRLSNHPGDADGNVTFEFDSEQPPVQHRDPSQIVTGVLVEYDGGQLFVDSDSIGLTTKTDYYVRQVVAPAPNIKTVATARRFGERYLRAHSKEEDSASVRVLLPSTHVGLIKAGHRIECRFDHFEPEYRAFTWWRVQEHSWAQKSRKWYWVNLELEPLPVTCPAPTAAGFYPPNLQENSTGTGNVKYFRTGGFEPGYTPDPSYDGYMNFASYNVAGNDFAGDCVANSIFCIVAGDGTIAIQTRAGSSVKTLIATLAHQNPADPGGDPIIDATQTGIVPGAVITFNVSTHGGTNCNHRIRVTDIGSPEACGGNWGFGGFTWTPTL